MNTTYEQQLTANFVHNVMQKNPMPFHAARVARLKDLMRGKTSITDEDGKTSQYAIRFDGVLPLTELLAPEWEAPVAEVEMTLIPEAPAVSEAA